MVAERGGGGGVKEGPGDAAQRCWRVGSGAKAMGREAGGGPAGGEMKGGGGPIGPKEAGRGPFLTDEGRERGRGAGGGFGGSKKCGTLAETGFLYLCAKEKQNAVEKCKYLINKIGGAGNRSFLYDFPRSHLVSSEHMSISGIRKLIVSRDRRPSRRPSCELVGVFQSLHGPQLTAAIGGLRLSLFRSQKRCMTILPYHSYMYEAPWMCKRGHGVQSAPDTCGIRKSAPMLMFIFMHSKKITARNSHRQKPQNPRIYARDAPNNRRLSGLEPFHHTAPHRNLKPSEAPLTTGTQHRFPKTPNIY